MNFYPDHKTGEIKLAKYRQDHMLVMHDILHEKIDYSGFIISKEGGNTCRRYKAASKAELARRVAMDALRIVMDDLIENNNIYQLPVKRGACLRIIRRSEKSCAILSLDSAKAEGYYDNVDFFATDGAFYYAVMEYRIFGGVMRRRMIRLNQTWYQRIVAKANTGFTYFAR